MHRARKVTEAIRPQDWCKRVGDFMHLVLYKRVGEDGKGRWGGYDNGMEIDAGNYGRNKDQIWPKVP